MLEVAKLAIGEETDRAVAGSSPGAGQARFGAKEQPPPPRAPAFKTQIPRRIPEKTQTSPSIIHT